MNRFSVRRTLGVAALLGFTWIAARTELTTAAPAEAPDKVAAIKPIPADVREFMHRKLDASQQVLKGLTTEDFDLVKTGTAVMIEMSKEALWRQTASAAYVQDTADFVGAAEFIIQRAENEDLHGAALGYAQLTLSCVNCHKHVRSSGIAVAPVTPGRVVR
ncbi:MAG: hypothetical protein AB7U20_09260 [Planctomycetaceae bacterium]